MAFVAILATSVVSVGLAVLFWLPLLVMLGGVGWTVWTARRRRQVAEGRDDMERRDALHSPRKWPKGVVDDRLPEE